eukprot:TRINITY_DN8010_c0_g1_i1.p1 TRINITY_DN8010_c0_g1~~TRINITY_DN8010_c0_g1_i1.p1  ORF type:complete len:1195 (-),score=251.45 TRINITY_DN8010_c0_g1_i1:279-3863(-)
MCYFSWIIVVLQLVLLSSCAAVNGPYSVYPTHLCGSCSVLASITITGTSTNWPQQLSNATICNHPAQIIARNHTGCVLWTKTLFNTTSTCDIVLQFDSSTSAAAAVVTIADAVVLEYLPLVIRTPQPASFYYDAMVGYESPDIVAGGMNFDWLVTIASTIETRPVEVLPYRMFVEVATVVLQSDTFDSESLASLESNPLASTDIEPLASAAIGVSCSEQALLWLQRESSSASDLGLYLVIVNTVQQQDVMNISSSYYHQLRNMSSNDDTGEVRLRLLRVPTAQSKLAILISAGYNNTVVLVFDRDDSAFQQVNISVPATATLLDMSVNVASPDVITLHWEQQQPSAICFIVYNVIDTSLASPTICHTLSSSNDAVVLELHTAANALLVSTMTATNTSLQLMSQSQLSLSPAVTVCVTSKTWGCQHSALDVIEGVVLLAFVHNHRVEIQSRQLSDPSFAMIRSNSFDLSGWFSDFHPVRLMPLFAVGATPTVFAYDNTTMSEVFLQIGSYDSARHISSPPLHFPSAVRTSAGTVVLMNHTGHSWHATLLDISGMSFGRFQPLSFNNTEGSVMLSSSYRRSSGMPVYAVRAYEWAPSVVPYGQEAKVSITTGDVGRNLTAVFLLCVDQNLVDRIRGPVLQLRIVFRNESVVQVAVPAVPEVAQSVVYAYIFQHAVFGNITLNGAVFFMPPNISYIEPAVGVLFGGYHITFFGQFDDVFTATAQVTFGSMQVEVLSVTNRTVVVQAPVVTTPCWLAPHLTMLLPANFERVFTVDAAPYQFVAAGLSLLQWTLIAAGSSVFVVIAIILLCCLCRRSSQQAGTSANGPLSLPSTPRSEEDAPLLLDVPYHNGSFQWDVGVALDDEEGHAEDAGFIPERPAIVFDVEAGLLTRANEQLTPQPEHAPTITRFAINYGDHHKASGLSMRSDTSLFAFRWEELQLGECIGRGSFGSVFKATLWSTTVAVKQLHLADGPDQAATFAQEVQTLRGLRHPHIVLFLAASDKHMAIVTEYVEAGSLYNLIRTQPQVLTVERAMAIAVDVASAMRYLHGRSVPVLHRDLKSANVLLTRKLRAKIADFGFARLRNTDTSIRGAVGTAAWMAPELTRNEPFTERSDVYSFGVVLWELFMLREPFEGIDSIRLLAMKLNGETSYLLLEDLAAVVSTPGKSIPSTVQQLIRDCLQERAEHRPLFAEICERLQ